MFSELDEVTPGHAILASNTSSLSITEMGKATSRPALVVGFHYFYPASVMRLVEVVEGEDTAPEAVQGAINFAQAIRKLPIRCQEAPGFVVNRILNSSVSELWRYQVETQGPDAARTDCTLELIDYDGSPIATYTLIQAWPSKYTGAAMNAGSNEVAVEAMTICHEGFKRM